jgi:Fur family peroxide stress response transcriptional regulator
LIDQKDFSEILQAKGFKVTPQRWIIFKTLQEVHNHPTAEELYSRVRLEHSSISLATVYKCLEALVEAGIVNKIDSKADAMRYDAKKEEHFHLIDTNTLSISDYHNEELNVLIYKYLEKADLQGKTFKKFSLNIYTE